MGSSFKCFYCQQYHSDVPSLLDHTNSHVIEDRATILSKYIPKGKRTLQVDISNVTCKICNKKYFDLGSVKEHLKQNHEKQFFGPSNGITEYNMETVNDTFKCHLCGHEFHSFSLLNSHMNSHVGKVVCENCGSRFINQYLLRQHRETHFTMKFKCKHCDREFFKRSQLKYHTKRMHEEKRVKENRCAHCSETFKEHYNKMVHLKEAHGILKSFRCHICNVSFSMRRALTEHTTKCHTEKYKCGICSKCFGIEFRLKQHMKGHTGEKNFACPICKNAYMHKITLQKHMRSHNSF